MNKNEILSADEEIATPPYGMTEEERIDKTDADGEAIGAYPEDEEIGEESQTVDEKSEDGDVEAKKSGEKEEYRRLIKTRFKEFYNEDAQRLINRRFRKYKEIEERFGETEKQLEDTTRQLEELRASLEGELEKAVKETEERVLNSIRQRRMRPDENGIARKTVPGKSDVSSLTKTERANIAKRAANGERIKL